METINNGVLVLSANREAAVAHGEKFAILLEDLNNDAVGRFLGDAIHEALTGSENDGKPYVKPLNAALLVCHNVQTIGGKAVADILQSSFNGVLGYKKADIGYKATIKAKHVDALLKDETNAEGVTAPAWQHKLRRKLDATVIVKNRKGISRATPATYEDKAVALYLVAFKAGKTQVELVKQQESLISAALEKYNAELAS